MQLSKKYEFIGVMSLMQMGIPLCFNSDLEIQCMIDFRNVIDKARREYATKQEENEGTQEGR